MSICLFCDTAPAEGIFDIFIRIDDPHHRSKLDCLPKSPYEFTLYLDNDTAVVGPIDEPFDLLERFHLAICHTKNRSHRLYDGKYAGGSAPSAFFPLNCGVMYYRLCEETRSLFEDWNQAYRKSDRVRDQVTFREALWARPEVKFYVLPFEFNIREVARLLFLNRDWQQPRILHLQIYQARRSFMQKLRKTIYRVPGPVAIFRNIAFFLRNLPPRRNAG